jgi:hypothetical protein
MAKKNLVVDAPPWYTAGGVETIDSLRASASDEEFAGFLRLSAIQYLSRAGRKVNDGESALEALIRDAQKAARYIEWLIEHTKSRL